MLPQRFWSETVAENGKTGESAKHGLADGTTSTWTRNLLLSSYKSAMEVELGFSEGEPFQAQPFQALRHNSASFLGASRRFTLGTSDSG